MAISKISGNMIDGSMTSSLVTGTLPAVSGAALLNAGSGIDTETTTNPLITSNPSGGVGTLWLNTTSGELFNCQVATTDLNVWVNIGSGLGDYGKAFGGQGGGVSMGYCAGGYFSGSHRSIIEKFSYTSDGNVIGTIGNLSTAAAFHAAASSATNGYLAGGGQPYLATIDKFSFSADGNASSIGNLSIGNDDPAGQSSKTNGYSSAGRNTSAVKVNTIETYSFASDGNATNHGNTVRAVMSQAGQSSATYGYTSGGNPTTNYIDKFSFASSGGGTTHSNMITGTFYFCGQSSDTDGFNSGGNYPSGSDTIEKFSFSSEATSTDHGNLSTARYAGSGSSSTTHGYTAGGAAGAPELDRIDKFTFSSSVTVTDVGNLSTNRRYGSGNQV